MKIGIVLWELNVHGGTQRLALNLARHLKIMANEVKIYTVYYDKERCYSDFLEELDVSYIYQSNMEKQKYELLLKRFFSPILNLFEYERLMKRIADMIDQDVDILNIHDYLTFFICPYFKKKFKKPIVWTMNDIPIGSGRPDISIKVFKRALIPFKVFIWNKRIINCVSCIDKIIALDISDKNKVRKYFNMEAEVIRGGLNLDKFKFQPKDPSEKIKIFCNGIFFPWRRLEDLIDALKILKDKNIDFVVNHVGSDQRDKNYAKKIYRRIKNYKLENYVNFHGTVTEQKLIHFYRTSDIFVFPNYPQSWGLAVFEAMACGTPAIVSRGAGATEVLTDYENALLVNPKSPDQIANKIIELKENDVLWSRLHINGRKFVEENIRWDLYTKNTLKVFDEVMSRYG